MRIPKICLEFAVWFFDLRDGLPIVTVPLHAPAVRIDYRQPPPSPALRPADATWAVARGAAHMFDNSG